MFLGFKTKLLHLALNVNLDQLGRYPLMLNVIQYITKFVTNVISKPCQSLSYKALLCQVNSQGNKSFSSIFRKIMDWGGVNNIPSSTRTNSSIAKLIKSKLIDWYKHHVLKRIKLESTSNTNNCKLRTYLKIKHNFSYEKYLDSNNSKLRQNVAKLRLSNHNLPIERGRYKNIELKNRTCKMCNADDIGDEFHLLMKCKSVTLVELRKQFLSTLLEITPRINQSTNQHNGFAQS